MRSSLVVRASDCQCTSCNGPGFDLSIRRHTGIWGTADEAVLNKVRKKIKKIPPLQKNLSLVWKSKLRCLHSVSTFLFGSMFHKAYNVWCLYFSISLYCTTIFLCYLYGKWESTWKQRISLQYCTSSMFLNKVPLPRQDLTEIWTGPTLHQSGALTTNLAAPHPYAVKSDLLADIRKKLPTCANSPARNSSHVLSINL
jgi:hypothetical protein